MNQMGMLPKTNNKLYLLTITAIPQTSGIDILKIVKNISTLLCDYSSATKVLHKFKVTGECKVLSVIQVANVIGLERTIGGIVRQGAVELTCSPLVNYEIFARSIKVPDHLTKKNTGTLASDGLYWLEFDVGYGDKTTDELISIWRKEAEAVLTARHKEGTSIELYKVVAQRKIHVFINAADPEQVDLLSFQLPMMQENGSNVQIKCKSVQLLDEYCGRITAESV